MFLGFLFYAIFTSESWEEDRPPDSGLCDSLDTTNPITDPSSYYNCPKTSKLKTITISGKVGKYAFYNNHDIEKIILKGVTQLNEGAFAQMNSLTTISLAEGTTKLNLNIPINLLRESSSLKTFPFDDSITTYGEYSFYNCYELNSPLAFSENSYVQINQYAFYNTKIRVTTIPSRVTVYKRAFSYCTSLTELVFNGNFDSNAEYAFAQSSLTKLTLYDGNNIPNYAFAFCSQLTALTFGTTSTNFYSIGENAFYGTQLAGELSFPDQLTSIGDEAFSGLTGITSLNLNKVISLSNSAFKGCTGITGVLDLKEVKSIGESTFQGCTKISGTLDLKKVTSLDKSSFQGCTAITALTISKENSFKSIPESAFQGCTRIGGTINMLNIESIDKYAFKGCTSIKGLSLPNVNSVDKSAFQDCTSLAGALSFSRTVNLIGKCAFQKTAITSIYAYLSSTGQYNIQESAFSEIKTLGKVELKYAMIDSKAFENSKISTLILENTNIGTDAFLGATGGFQVTITDGQIQEHAFMNAIISKLTIISEDMQSQVGSSAFENAQISTSITINHVKLATEAFRGLKRLQAQGPELIIARDVDSTYKNEFESYAFYDTGIFIKDTTTFDENVTKIGDYAFAYCNYLTGNLNINCPTIGQGAFLKCNYRGALTLGDGVQTLDLTGTRANTDSLIFEGCNFNSLYLSKNESFTAIPPKTFYKMSGIANTATISKTINTIGNQAFYGCGGLTLNFENNSAAALTIGDEAFYGVKSVGPIIRSISNIPSYCFYKCPTMTNFYFSPDTTSIGEFAFAGSALNSISLPNNLQSIGEGAFMNCRHSGNLVIPDSVILKNTNPGDSTNDLENFCPFAFYKCAIAGQLTLSRQITTIPRYCFFESGIQSSLDLSNVHTIEEHAFEGCPSLTSVRLYDPLEGPAYSTKGYVGESAFSGCTGLTNHLSFEYIQSIGEKAFYKCPITTVNFGKILNRIPDRAFYQCAQLQGSSVGNLVIPKSIGSIGDEAFFGCAALTGNIIFDYDETSTPSSPYEIGKYAFNGCTNLNGQLNFSKHFSSIKEHAFAGLTGLSGPLDLSGVQEIGDYAFEGCTGLTDYLRIEPYSSSSTMTIGRGAFKGCTGFNDGTLYIYVKNNEEDSQGTHYDIAYFLRIEDEAFEDTKFEKVFYSGRFEPDCTDNTGLKKIKKFKPYNYYANKSFCGKKVKGGLSGGAIAGIVIACIVVVAAIVVLVVFLILRNKRNGDNSENEVEMNGSP